MDIVFSGIGILFLNAFVALALVAAAYGQYRVLLAAQGRIKRQTFWEGLMAWFLLNVLCLILGIANFCPAYDEQLAANFGDVDHVGYHRLIMTFTVFCWLGSVWILAMLCAKRWHDLNFSGWLALINALPLLAIGYAWCVFLDSVSRVMNKQFAAKYSMADLWQQMTASMPSNGEGWSFWSLILSCGLIIALGAYLGFAKGDAGANAYGKTAA
jgi:uncharacterized membrane protein YhaH (DUF805 family)